MKAPIIAIVILVVVGLISGCGGSSAPSSTSEVAFRSMSSPGTGDLAYKTLASSLVVPGNVSSGVYVFRSMGDWSNFWSGEPPVLPFVGFATNMIIAAVNIGSADLDITGLRSSPSGVIIDAIKIDGIGTIPIDVDMVRTPDGRIITIPPITPSGGPHALIIETPIFSGEANVNITSTYWRP